MLLRLFTSPQIKFLFHNRFHMSIKIDNKFPETEEEKQNMKQPYAVAKCPNQ